MAPRTFSECEGSRLGGTDMVYNVFSKLICILVMAEGIDPTDPTTEKTPLIPDTGDDDDDDSWNNVDWSTIPVDPDDPETTQPFKPGGASTPYPEDGEEYEMTRLPQESQGPLTLDNIALREIEGHFPNMAHTELEFRYKEAPKSGGVVIEVKHHNSKKWYRLFTQSKGEAQKTLNTNLPKNISTALGESAEEMIAEDNTALRDTQRRLDEAQQAEVRLNAQAQKQEQEAQERQRLETQLEQINQRIDNMVNEGGTEMERQMETDRLKRERAKLKRDIDAAKKLEKGYAQTAKEQNKAAKEVERLKRQYENQRQKRDTTEATLNRTKPLDELEREREELKRKIEEYREIMDDKDATTRERMAAGEQFSENTDELARLETQIQEREEALPLRERIKNIFKKYGWTLQAIVIAVGVVLSVLSLVVTNGLKNGIKAIGNGLKALGNKLTPILPGLIGSIVSYIFKAAGSVLSFLGEHAWLLILAVVAFFMERMLKRRRR